MARYTGPTDRISRRAGVNLFLKGERSYGPKNPLVRRPYPPGQPGNRRRPAKPSEYGRQLREKQKAKAIYGILERQFRRYYQEALRGDSDTGATLIQLLERRLDNIVFRLGLADSRRQARQYVSHGHVTVDGKRISLPSYQVKGDQDVQLEHIDRKPAGQPVPEWLERVKGGRGGKVLGIPTREQIPAEIEEQLIVEFYSR